MTKIKKIISILLSLLIIIMMFLCSAVLVSADTVVDSGKIDKEYFINLFNTYSFDYNNPTLNLSALPVNDYDVIFSLTHSTSGQGNISICFIPKKSNEDYKTNKHYNNQNEYFSEWQSIDKSKNYTVSWYDVYGTTTVYLGTDFMYYIGKSGDGIYNSLSIMDDWYGLKFQFGSNHFNSNADLFFTNNENLFNVLNSATDSDGKKSFKDVSNGNFINTGHEQIAIVPNLMTTITQLINGYTGEVLDKSLETILSEKGLYADNSIYDNYKNKIHYFKNNDLVMSFLNNSDKPEYEKEEYTGINEDSVKYKFTYSKTYDAVIYFPQYQKYLTYDDWYEAQPQDGFKWFWEEDKKKFTLISDWTVTFNELGQAAYSGTRVVMSWDIEYGEMIDGISLIDPWQDDTEELKDKGWLKGRPTDMAYPYCIEYYINGMPTLRIYFNAMPRIEVYRTTDTKCRYNICMLGMAGYVYDVSADLYSKFDCTINTDIENYYNLKAVKIINDCMEAYHTAYKCLDDELQLALYEYYKGNDTYFIGSKMYFNWDIHSNMFVEEGSKEYNYYDYILDNVGGYVDENGNGHGGNITDYEDEELNNYNQGNTDIDNSTNFEFTEDKIFDYTKDFFSFLKPVFDTMPSWFWLIISATIVVLITLRILGR